MESLHLIRDSGKVLEIELPNGLIISIDPKTITDYAVSINLDIGLTVTDTATTVSGVQIPLNSIILSPSARGDFGFSISIYISAQMLADAGLTSDNVRLFHVSSNGSVIELDNVIRNNDGSVTVIITHASWYVLSNTAPQGIIPHRAPQNRAPQTGDNRNIILPVAVLALGVMCIVGAEIYRRRLKKSA